MRSQKLFEAFSYIDDWYLDIADAPVKESSDMKKETKRFSARKTFTVLLAAVICVSLLAVTAAAAGWIPNIFKSVKPGFPEDEEILEKAVQVTQAQEPEIVEVPEVDYTKFTLFERYYDGESIAIGYDLSKIMPEPVVGFQPDDALLAKIKEMPEWQRTVAPGQKDDNLETMYAMGFIPEEVYRGTLESRTEYAKQYGLDKYWQIVMDNEMKHILSEEQYEKFWDILLENGSCCVAVPSDPWIGDHIYVNDTDCGEVLGPDCGNFRMDYTTDVGDCILLNPLPEAGRNQDSVTVDLSLRSGWYYWYMELDGDVYSHFENNPAYEASFTLENVNN